MTENPRTEPALESRHLMRQATWCGVVFSLAVLMTILNVLPPVAVYYDVSSEIIMSPNRLERLEAYVHGETQPTRAAINHVKVLDRANLDASDLGNQGLLLVHVDSRWSSRCDEASHEKWLASMTETDRKELTESEVASEGRFARWELATAEHYAQRHDYLSESGGPVTTTDGRVFQLASHSETAPTQLVSQQSGAEEANAAVLLEQQIESAKAKVSQSEVAWRQALEQSSGQLRFAGDPIVRPRTSTIPWWMAASVLIVGIAAAASAGWVQHRLQSGGVYDPTSIARELGREGIKNAGQVELATGMMDESDWMELATRRASDAGRRAARHFSRMSEWALGFWVLLIVGRIIVDPLWRRILFESPLAAFGRLLSGMP